MSNLNDIFSESHLLLRKRAFEYICSTFRPEELGMQGLLLTFIALPTHISSQYSS